MLIITPSNGRRYHYNNAVSPIEIATDINLNLAKTTIAGRINGRLADVFDLIEQDANLSIITTKENDTLKIIRNLCTQLLGYAIEQLWSNAKLVISIVVANNFYCNINLDHILTRDDINELERRMYELTETNYDVIKKQVSWQEAYAIFTKRNNIYKLIFLNENIYRDNTIDLHHHYKYVDISLGLQVPNMIFCHHFKLIKTTTTNWSSKSKSKTLQRIYSTAWTKKES